MRGAEPGAGRLHRLAQELNGVMYEEAFCKADVFLPKLGVSTMMINIAAQSVQWIISPI